MPDAEQDSQEGSVSPYINGPRNLAFLLVLREACYRGAKSECHKREGAEASELAATSPAEPGPGA
jgi:hypothetical protein